MDTQVGVIGCTQLVLQPTVRGAIAAAESVLKYHFESASGELSWWTVRVTEYKGTCIILDSYKKYIHIHITRSTRIVQPMWSTVVVQLAVPYNGNGSSNSWNVHIADPTKSNNVRPEFENAGESTAHLLLLLGRITIVR